MNIETITWPNFLQIINDRAKEIKFVPKVENSQSFTKEIVNLANNKGGVVIIGFDNHNYQLPGVKFDKRWLWAVIKNECKPEPECLVKEIIRNMRRVYIIEVAEGQQKPYSIFSVSFAQEEQPNAAAAAINNKQSEESVLLDQLQNESIRKRHKKCLEFLKNNNDITNSQYRTINAVSHKTAHNELSYLVKSGLLRSVGQGRSTKYVLASSAEGTGNNEISAVVSNHEESIETEDQNNDEIISENTINNTNNFAEITNDDQEIVSESEADEPEKEEDPIRLTDFKDDNGQPSLFDLAGELEVQNKNSSKTDIRKAFDIDHMEQHVNNDIFDNSFELEDVKIEEPDLFFK